jgi:hypothetical protein
LSIYARLQTIQHRDSTSALGHLELELTLRRNTCDLPGAFQIWAYVKCFLLGLFRQHPPSSKLVSNLETIKMVRFVFIIRVIFTLTAVFVVYCQYLALFQSSFYQSTTKEYNSIRFFQANSDKLLSPIKPHTKQNYRYMETLDAGVVARSFTWNSSLPCLKPDYPMRQKHGFRQPATNGFLFMKLVKTGGSTAAGVAMRIAKRTAKRENKKFWICRGRWDHSWAFKMLKDRRRDESFTWTLLREPTKRAISQFFHFEVSRENTSSSDESFQKYLSSSRNAKIQRNFYLKILSLQRVVPTDDTAPFTINSILSEYDFIGITERMDESMVTLMMLLDLPMGDILYLNAKGNGGYDDGAHRGMCYYIHPSYVSPGMSSFFESPQWLEMTKWDRLLYQAANRSLDLTIDRLGRDRFNKNLREFRYMNKVAQDRCLPLNVFPCTSTGQHNKNESCLWSDSGCGYKCLDQVALDHNV